MPFVVQSFLGAGACHVGNVTYWITFLRALIVPVGYCVLCGAMFIGVGGGHVGNVTYWITLLRALIVPVGYCVLRGVLFLGVGGCQVGNLTCKSNVHDSCF